MSGFLGGLLSDINGGGPQPQSAPHSTLRQPIPAPRNSLVKSSDGSHQGPKPQHAGDSTSTTRRVGADKVDSSPLKKQRLSAGSPSVVPKPASNLRAAAGSLQKSRSDVISKFPATASARPLSASSAGSTPAATAPPKKGSFRDIMERGKRAHEARIAQGAGQIKHKETLKLSRQERLKIALQEKQKMQGTRAAPIKQATSPGRLPPGNAAAPKAQPVVAPQKRERPPLDYKGTMRSVTSSPKPKNGREKRPHQVSRHRLDASEDEELDDDDPYARRYHYAGSSDEDETDDDDDDDLAGGGFEELEAEEEMSLRAARKEDAAALREETAHKNDKLARKKQLEALKNARAAKRA